MFRLFLVASAAALFSFAQTPEYFPLQVGNQWVYRTSTGQQTRQIEVTGQQTVNDVTYYTVTGYAGTEALIRRLGDQLVRYDAATKSELLIEDFGAAAGQTFSTAIDSCTRQGTLADKSGTYTGPIGAFDSRVLVVTYTDSCADAGLLEDRYIAYVGLISRTEQTIAGPRRFDLVYSNTGGVTSVTAPHVSFGISLDQGTYKPGAPFLAQLNLKNTTDTPLTLEWFSLQRFEMQIFDASGNEVYRWSNGIAFPQLASTEKFQGERNWVVSTLLQDNNITPLPVGRYLLQGYLTTRSPLPKKYTASIGFEIQ